MTGRRRVLPGLRLPLADEAAALDLARRGVGGFCLFGGGSAAEVAALVARLQDAAPHPLLVASDLEDGAGQQIAGLSRHPPAAALDPAAAEAAGMRTALEAQPLGITMTFAPVCDVVSDPRNPILQARAFRDPAACAPAFVRGARRMGLRTCAKHFPGHGATTEDSHDALPVVEADAATWQRRDLPPFRACIEAGVDAVMTAHLACPALTGSPDLPATLSRAVMTDLLRGELGFAGLVVSDALLMDGVLRGRSEAEAAVLAAEAGCDVLLVPRDVEGVLAAVERIDDEAAVERIAAAAEPLPEPFAESVARSVAAGGELPVGPGPHPLRICDLHGGGEAFAAAAGVRFEHLDQDGGVIGRGGGNGLAVPAVAILRADRAWSGGLGLPPAVRALAAEAGLVVVLGPQLLLEGLAPAAWVRAPGQDPLTVAEVVRRAFR